MKRIISKIITRIIQRLHRSIMIGDLSMLFTNNHDVKNTYRHGEDLFIKKWKKLDKHVSPMAYRFYANYIGEQPDIVPDDVARQYIEPILNQGECVKFYNDKNSFGLFIDGKDMPKTLFRSIGYKLYDGEYNAITKNNFLKCFDKIDHLIIKPAKELGGRGIVFFERKNGLLTNSEDIELTLEYLETTYKTDFLIQECFIQSKAMSLFNSTSINTIRINTYRDIQTGEIHILGASLRIGSEGARVDNATAGGVIIGINDCGKLANCAYDKYGHSCSIHNNIDFEKTELTIPNFDNVKEFAIKITKRLPHMRLLALDIALDVENNPKLIEVNSSDFSTKFLQLTKQPVFGEYTDEIIKYCIENKKLLNIGLHFTLKKQI